MRPIVVLSTNDDDNYLFFLPIVTWAWNRLGWDTLTLMPKGNRDHVSTKMVTLVQEYTAKNKGENYIHEFDTDPNYREDTLTQCSRLYACYIAQLSDDTYLLTSDIDMMPLSDYWAKHTDKPAIYGHDLTNFAHVPICYVGASVGQWQQIMSVARGMGLATAMSDDLVNYDKARSNDKTDYWCTDQDILTDKLAAYGYENTEAHLRGSAITGLPVGRVDRAAWHRTLQQPERIDAHLLRPGYLAHNFNQIISFMIGHFKLTHDEIEFFEKYRKEFTQLIA